MHVLQWKSVHVAWILGNTVLLRSFIVTCSNNVGEMCMVFCLQGFEIAITGWKFFAFSKFEGNMTNATSYCGETMKGWAHDVFGRHWMCYYGEKMEKVPPKPSGFMDDRYNDVSTSD